MKKIVQILSLLSLFIVSTSVAYSAEVCPDGQFSTLCELNANDNTNFFQNIFTILLISAIGLSLGFLMYGGIKWILSGGDKGKVDAARGTVTAAIVGLIVAFLAFFIIGLVNFVFGIESSNGTVFKLPTLRDGPAD